MKSAIFEQTNTLRQPSAIHQSLRAMWQPRSAKDPIYHGSRYGTVSVLSVRPSDKQEFVRIEKVLLREIGSLGHAMPERTAASRTGLGDLRHVVYHGAPVWHSTDEDHKRSSSRRLLSD